MHHAGYSDGTNIMSSAFCIFILGHSHRIVIIGLFNQGLVLFDSSVKCLTQKILLHTPLIKVCEKICRNTKNEKGLNRLNTARPRLSPHPFHPIRYSGDTPLLPLHGKLPHPSDFSFSTLSSTLPSTNPDFHLSLS